MSADPVCRLGANKDVRQLIRWLMMLLQALWLHFAPSLTAVDPDSWRLHKLGGLVSPLGVLLNGSQAQHAVGPEGVHVLSRDHLQRLSIRWGSGRVLQAFPCVCTAMFE